MGVPGLFRWISMKCRRAVNTVSKDTKNFIKIDTFFIDTNAIIHEFAQKVFNYGQYKRMLYSYQSLSYDEKIKKIYELTFDKIVNLCKVVNCNTLLIAIDGVAPAGKMAQQRQRRFVASLSQKKLDFDSNCISCGTEFMEGLRSYFQYRILMDFENINANTIIFSSSDVPGEGEHKALMYLRSNKSETNAIFGPDGDLIMLTLGREENFYIVRDDLFEVGKYSILNVDEVKKEILKHISNIDDFILMGFFVGNDFLPKLQMFYYLDDGMNFLFEIYKKLGLQLTKKKRISKNFLTFCSVVQEYEKNFLESQIELNVNTEEKFRNTTLINCSKNNVLNFKKYRKSYNKRNSIDKNCVRDYLQGIEWVFEYYLKGCKDYTYCYKHHYPPLVCDIVKYFKILSRTQNEEPPYPIEQLLAILPPSSKILIPSETHIVYKELPSLYPKTFNIDYEGKYKEYQGVALLPFMDIEKIKSYCARIPKKRGYVLYFKRSNEIYSYKTSYGTVRKNIKITKSN